LQPEFKHHINIPMEEKNNFAENLRILRTRCGYTQDTVSAYLGITQSAYNKYEAGVNDVPMETLEKLALLYNVEEYDLLAGNMENMQADMVFAFRKGDANVDLTQIAQFQKIVKNYLEMTDELSKK
jgi:transcriptional regulator with XRE-family HTH domain